jgi:hypothetical protein
VISLYVAYINSSFPFTSLIGYGVILHLQASNDCDPELIHAHGEGLFLAVPQKPLNRIVIKLNIFENQNIILLSDGGRGITCLCLFCCD